jgi:uncharacterized protein YbjQ (UPF0145 family)
MAGKGSQKGSKGSGGGSSKGGKEENREDFTLLENLGEFVHIEDEEINTQLETFSRNRAPTGDETPPQFATQTNAEIGKDELEEEKKSTFGEGLSEEENLRSPSESEETLEENFGELPKGDEGDTASGETKALPENHLDEEIKGDFSSTAILPESDLLNEDLEDFPSDPINFSDEDPKKNSGKSETDYSFKLSNQNTSEGIDLPNSFDFSTPTANPSPSSSARDEWSQSGGGSSGPSRQKASSETAPFRTGPLEEIKNFASSISYTSHTKASGSAGPPYSVLVNGITFIEDAKDILDVLKDFDLVSSQNEENIKKSLEMGQLLISQISEYMAIHLVHALRRFELDMTMGLSEEISPSKYFQNVRGLTHKESLHQNYTEHANLANQVSDIKNILISTTPHLVGHEILRYLGIVTNYLVVEEEEIFDNQAETSAPSKGSVERAEVENNTVFDLLNDFQTFLKESKSQDGSEKNWRTSLEDKYKTLTDKLRTEAFKIGANAIVGVQFQMVPLMATNQNNFKSFYKILCSGSAVLVH